MKNNIREIVMKYYIPFNFLYRKVANVRKKEEEKEKKFK